MIMNSTELWAERKKLADMQAQAVEAGDSDAALRIEGQIAQLDITIEHVLDEEQRMRSVPSGVPMGKRSVGELILGSREEFKGLEFGFRNAVVTIGAPQEYDLDIPAKGESLLANFASTLQEVAAIGTVNYKQRSTQTGAPDTWAGVSAGTSATKEQVIYTWVDAVANKETIAGYVPISKDTLKDYDGLLSIIESDLTIDLEDKTDNKYLVGNNATGIVGITNTTGIQAYTTHESGDYYRAIRKMRTLCIQNARRVPTHVCMSPEIKQEIDLHKTTDGYYQSLGDGIYWGMQVVEDVNCPGIIVYDAYAAKRRSIHGLSIEVGYYNDQFIKNELSILAEHTKALQVTYPNAFVYATKTDLDAS